MPDLEYKIITSADLAGAEAAKSSLGKLTETTDETKKSLKNAGEKTEKLNVKGRELYRVAAVVDRIVPGAGEAIRAFGQRGDETALAIVGLTAALEIALITYKKIEEGAQSASKALATLMEEKGIADAIDAQRKAWEDADLAEANYYHNLLLHTDDEVKRLTDSAVAIAKRKQAAQQQIDDATKAVEEAKIDARERNGVISHDEALKEKYALDVKYLNLRLDLERQFEAEELKTRQRELDIKRGQQPAVTRREQESEAAYRGASGALEKHNELLKTYQGNIDKSKDAIKETNITDDLVQSLRESFEKITGRNSATTNLSDQYDALKGLNLIAHPSIIKLMDQLGSRGGEAGLADYQMAQKDIASNQRLLTGEQAKDFGLKEAADFAKDNLEAARKAKTELDASVAELQNTVQAMAAANQANQQNATTVARLKAEAEAIKTGQIPATVPTPPHIQAASPPAPPLPTSTMAAPQVPYEQSTEGRARHDFGLARDYSDVLAAGGKLNEVQQETFKAIAKAILGHTASQKEMVNLVQELHSTLVSNQQDINQKFAILIRDLKTTSARQQNSYLP